MNGFISLGSFLLRLIKKINDREILESNLPHKRNTLVLSNMNFLSYTYELRLIVDLLRNKPEVSGENSNPFINFRFTSTTKCGCVFENFHL